MHTRSVAACVLLVLIVVPSVVSAQYLTAREVLSAESAAAGLRIAYGAHEYQFGELRLPEGAGPHPVLVVVHGGCWLSFADLTYMSRFAEDLTEAGVATWNLEYRPVDVPTGGWPNTFLDVAQGVDHVRQMASAHDLDLSRVMVTGHSAGGHLALWVAGRHRLDPSSPIFSDDPLPIAGVVSLAGVGDVEPFRSAEGVACGPGVVDRLFGGSPSDVPDRYAAGSPAALLPFGVPQRLLTGNADEAVPPRFGVGYAKRATATGDDARAETLDGAAHFEVVVPGSAVWPDVRQAILALFGL